MGMQMLDGRTIARRKPLPQPSTSANRAGRIGLAARNSAHSVSARWNSNARAGARASAKCRSPRSERVPQESHDWETIQKLFQTARPRFVGLAYSILRNKEDAEDAVQDAMISAFRHLRGFEGRSALTTWFTRIVVNAALMIRRKRQPARVEILPDTSAPNESSWTENIPDLHPDPEMMFAEQETFQRIDVLLGKMSPMLRQAFSMTYYDELSNEEGGALLGVTTGTFKSRVFRARQDLRNRAQREVRCSYSQGGALSVCQAQP